MPSGLIQSLRSVRIGRRITLMVSINIVVAALFLGLAWWASQRVDQGLEALDRLRSQSRRVENISKKSLHLMLLARQLMDDRAGEHTFSQITVYGNDLERIIRHEASMHPDMAVETDLLLDELNTFQEGAWEVFALHKAQSEEFRAILDLGETVGGFLAIVSANARGAGYYEILPDLEKVNTWLAKLIASVNRFYFSGEDAQVATSHLETLSAYLPALARRSGSELRQRYLMQAGGILDQYRKGLLDLIEGKVQEKELAVYKLNEPQAEIQRVINRMLSHIASAEREASDKFRKELERVAAYSIGLIGASLVLSLLLSWAIGRSITAPLSALHRAVRDQAAGRPVGDIPEGGEDELTALAGTVRKVVDLQAEKDQLIGDLREARDQVQHTLRQIRTLLDNSGQGVISFGGDLLVEPEYSRESLAIFGREDMTKARAPYLLFPDDDTARERMAVNLRRICNEKDDFKRDMLLSLMPKEVAIHDRVVEVQYRPLDDARLMLILTDVTEERHLADTVEAEGRRLALIVGAVTNRDELLDVIDDFNSFLGELESGQTPQADAGGAPGALAGRIFRLVHTYKGLFALMDCIQLPLALQEAETRLAEVCAVQVSAPADGKGGEEAAAARRALAPESLRLARDRDLDVIRETLGDTFLETRGEVVLPEERAQTLMEFASKVGRRLADSDDGKIKEGLRILRELRLMELQRLLARYPRMALQLAERMDKELAPFEIEVKGDTVLVDPVRFSPFVRSLVHVFRNAVDHGIEGREERIEAGKEEAGRMGCIVRQEEDGDVLIDIWDDGRGIDVQALATRAREIGLDEAVIEAAGSDPALLVFAQGLSTMDCAQAAASGEGVENGAREFVSGRGVGMAAVKAELDKLGGHVLVDNRPGLGVCFTFRIPGTGSW